MTTLRSVLEHRQGLALDRARHAASLLRSPGEDRIDLQVEVESAIADLRAYTEQLDALDNRAAAGVYANAQHSWLADATLSQLDGGFDTATRQRLSQVETRAAGSSAFGGLVVPQYLVDLAALSVRSDTPLLTALGVQEPASVGLSFTIPRFTTPMTAAAINGENVAVTAVDPAVTNSTFTMSTIAARATVSRQFIERAPQGFDVLVAEMLAAIDAEIEREVVAGSGSSGEQTGWLSVSGTSATTYTDLSPTGLELLPKIAANGTAVVNARKQPATLVVAHPRRWLWLASQLTALTGAMDLGRMIMDMRRVATVAVPTNLGTGTDEDRIILVRDSDVAVQATPAQLVAGGNTTMAGQQSVDIVIYKCFLSMVRFATGIGVISGNGLNAVAA